MLKRDLLALENVNGGLKNKIETMKKQAKTLQEKLKFSGDESRTSCSKMEQKVKTLQFELKKKDATHERMKEQLKRHLEAKSYGYERNHIEITSRLHAAQECALVRLSYYTAGRSSGRRAEGGPRGQVCETECVK